MLITYSRPDTIGHDVDPDAPAADLDPAGATCDASTYDVGGVPWRCTRRPGHTDAEHRAAFELHGDGPRARSRSRGPTTGEGPVTVRPLPSPCTPSL